jgi:hypothetical protein
MMSDQLIQGPNSTGMDYAQDMPPSVCAGLQMQARTRSIRYFTRFAPNVTLRLRSSSSSSTPLLQLELETIPHSTQRVIYYALRKELRVGSSQEQLLLERAQTVKMRVEWHWTLHIIIGNGRGVVD